MKNRYRIYKLPALLLTLVLVLGTVSTGESDTVYSDWLRLDGLPENRDTRDLSLFLREAALLDAGGKPAFRRRRMARGEGSSVPGPAPLPGNARQWGPAV